MPSSRPQDETLSFSLLPSPPTHMHGHPNLHVELDVGEWFTSIPTPECAPTSPVTPVPPAPSPFHIWIPQVAWSDMLHSGRGGYYIAKTVEESLAVWHVWMGNNTSKERDGACSRGCVCVECQGCQGCMSVV